MADFAVTENSTDSDVASYPVAEPVHVETVDDVVVTPLHALTVNDVVVTPLQVETVEGDAVTPLHVEAINDETKSSHVIQLVVISSKFGIMSVVLLFLAIPFGLWPLCIALCLGLPAVVSGILAICRIDKERPLVSKGRYMAIAGVTFGVIGTMFSAAMIGSIVADRNGRIVQSGYYNRTTV
jgi:hypothetical protein